MDQVVDNRQVLREFILYLEKKKGIKTAKQRLFLIKSHSQEDIRFFNRCYQKGGIALTEHNVHKLRDLLGMSKTEMRDIVLEMIEEEKSHSQKVTLEIKLQVDYNILKGK